MTTSLKEMPKIELHCHLDGSMRLEVVRKLLLEMGQEYTHNQLKEKLCVPWNCVSLAEYLKCFDLPIQCLQTYHGLEKAAYDLAAQAAEENVKYLEVRFAPSFSTGQGLSIRQILEAVEKGLERGYKQFGIYKGIIVCGMRNLDMDTNLTMLKEARNFLGEGVVACDLAGDEKAFATSQFSDFFAMARRFQMPFTIHAGECGSRSSIRDAIEFGAKRLGHGIAMAKDEDLKRICAARRIGVEMCPTSNLQTKAVTDFSQYPFQEFMEAAVPVSINTDNRTVSNTTCTQEWERLKEAGFFRPEYGRRVYEASVHMSFASDDVKHELLKI